MKELSMIQAELRVSRSRKHEFIKGFKYWNVEDILEAAKPLLKEHSCHIVVADELVPMEGRLFVAATATITNGAGETASSRAYAQLCDHKGLTADQCTGVASTYARKYALNGLLAINDSQDSDECGPEPQPQPKQQRQAQPKRQAKPFEMTDEIYSSLIGMAADGRLTKQGEDPRDYYIRKCAPGQKQLDFFAADVRRALVAIAADGRLCADERTARERFEFLFSPDPAALSEFDRDTDALRLERRKEMEQQKQQQEQQQQQQGALPLGDEDDLPF